MIDSILISIFLSFPEAILVLLVGFMLSNIKVKLKKIILIACLQAGIAFTIRVLNISFGAHTIIQVMTFCILTTFILKVKLHRVVVPVLIGIFADSVIQELIISVANLLITIDFTRLGIEFKYTFMTYGVFVYIVFLSVVFIIKRLRFTICDLSVEGEFSGESK